MKVVNGSPAVGITCYFVLSLFSVLMDSALCAGQSVSLAWDPNPESDIAGYTVYYGYASGNYSYTNQVGNTNNTTINELLPGTNYCFVVTASNTKQVAIRNVTHHRARSPGRTFLI